MLGDILEGHDQSQLEEYLEAVDLDVIDLIAVNLQAVNLDAVNPDAVDWKACAMDAETVLIG